MLSQFQSSYQRVEQSLQRLTESIAAYNPSTSAADELLAADEAVSANLEQLIEHQSNHQRILALRQTAQDLDETIKRSVKLLSDTRRDILAIPSHNSKASIATTGGSNAAIASSVAAGEEAGQPREIAVDELLSYAKFISRTTVPPTFRSAELPPLPASVRGKAGAVNGNAAGSSATANANVDAQGEGGGGVGTVNTPAGIKQEDNVDGAANAPNNTNNASAQPQEAQRQQQPAADNDIEAQQWLSQSLPFEPWPSQSHLQMGILGDIQRMVESGKDPATILTAEEQAEADAKRKELEDKEREAALEAERRRMSLFDTGAGGGAGRKRDGAGDVFNPDDL